VQTVLLYIHILAACVWLGANVTQIIVNPAMQRIGGEPAAVWMHQTVRMGRIVYTPSAIVLLVTGVWMVTRSAVYQFEDVFVVIGVFAVVAGALFGMFIFAPVGRAAAVAYESHDANDVKSTQLRLATFGTIDTLIVLFAIWAMVNRLGA